MTADVAAPLNGDNVPQRGGDGRVVRRTQRGREEIQDRALGFVTLARRHPPKTCRQRNRRKSCRRLALHLAALSEFLGPCFSRPYSGATRPVDRNLMLDRLTDNLEIRRNATGEPAARQEQQAPVACGATGSERWRERQSALSARAAWADRWPGDCSTPAIRCASTIRRPRRPSRWSRAARGLRNRRPKSPPRADIVLASLPTPDIVKAVALGPDGIVAGNRATHPDRPVDHRARRGQADRGGIRSAQA